MDNLQDIALKFFDACETGKGWAQCEQYCHPDATFGCQADALADVKTLQAYTEWMKGFFTPVPDGQYELRSCAADDDQDCVVGYGVFRGTHTGQGGPLPPTGKQVVSDYVYVMEFDGDRIRHMTKIWNDSFAMKQLGWM